MMEITPHSTFQEVCEYSRTLEIEVAQLREQVKDRDKDIVEIKNVIFSVMDMLHLLNPEKTGMDEKFLQTMGEDGEVIDGENPVPSMFNGLTDLMGMYMNTLAKWRGKAYCAKALQDLKDKVSFVFKLKDIANKHSKVHGMGQIEEIEETKPPLQIV